MAADRPNIVLVMSDQQKASAASIYGNTLVQDPNVARLAREGVTFEHCFSSSPVCSPARASLMTGMHVPVHGCYSNRHEVAKGIPHLPELLRDVGYNCGVVGHYDAFANLDRGWDWAVDWWDPAFGLCQIFYQADELSKSVRPLRGWVSGVHPTPPNQNLAGRMTDYAIQYLHEVAREPFFLHVAYLEPHPPYFPPEPYASMYDPGRIDLPPQPESSHRPRWQEEAAEEMAMGLGSERQFRLAIARYYGLISYVDSQIGRLLDHLESQCLLGRTWVIFGSDHGDYTGEHGLFAKSHSMYDCLLHVPLVIRPPDDRWGGGRRAEGLVQFMDLFATICQLAGASPPDHCQAKSLADWVDRGAIRPLREAVFAAVGGRAQTPSFPQGMPARGIRRDKVRMIRTADRKYVQDPEEGDECYRLTDDPHELMNLYGEAEEAEVRPLLDGLDGWEKECREVRHALDLRG